MPSIRSIPHTLALLVAALLLLSCTSYTFKGTALEPAEPAPDFTLTDQHGQPFRLSEQQGKVTLLFFGYTTCPDICPATLADLAAVRRQLGSDAERLQVAFVTVDPERDTAERLDQYVQQFDPAIIALRGSADELAPVYKSYGVGAFPSGEHAEGSHAGMLNHTTSVYVIDPQRRWYALFDTDAPVEDMTSDVRFLLRG